MLYFGIKKEWLEKSLNTFSLAANILKKKKDCTICVAKAKALISFAFIAKLICAFVFAYANC